MDEDMRQLSLWIDSMNVCYQFFAFISAQRSASNCHEKFPFTSLMNLQYGFSFYK